MRNEQQGDDGTKASLTLMTRVFPVASAGASLDAIIIYPQRNQRENADY
jgi:hypothetical protein